MIKRFLQSRGVGKFRRNRMAMVGLGIISLYLLLTGFIVVTNTVNNHLFSLEGRPLLGLLLTSQTSQEFGPREMPGFGIKGSPAVRYEAAAFFLKKAENAFDNIDRSANDPESDPQRILMDYEIVGREFADLPIDDLKGIYRRGQMELDRAIEMRLQLSAIDSMPLIVQEIEEARAGFESLVASGDTESDDVVNRQEDVAFALEEIAEQIEKYQGGADTENAMTALDTSIYWDEAGRILDADPVDLDMYDPEIISGVLTAAEDARASVVRRTSEQVDKLAPIVEELFPQPTGLARLMNMLRLSLGTDLQGRSILLRALYSAKIAIQVGVVTAIIAVTIGTLLGSAAAFFGGIIDHAVNWLYSMFTSIPYLVLLALLTILFMNGPFEGTLIPLYVAFGLTYWIGPCRVIRGESMKIKELEFVQAATALGYGRFSILLKHIIPNTTHLMFINFSLLLIAAIKGEVILTFLGLGLKKGASWGIMIRDSAPQVTNDNFWQIGAATFFMFALVLAFNILSDALQDAFDPKHQG